MTQRRSIRIALLALTLLAVYSGAAAVVAGPAQAAVADGISASKDAAAGSSTFTRIAYDPAKIDAAKARPALVGAATATRTINAPLAGFCTLDGTINVTSYITCSVVVPATAYIWCTNGNIFFAHLPGPGVYSGSATPCLAYGYSLV
jgi:hypothetical protein